MQQPPPAPAIRPLTPDDVEVLRTIRLAALRTDPGAFGQPLAQAAALTPSAWQAMLQRYVEPEYGAILAAFPPAGGPCTGMAGVGRDQQDPQGGFLWGVFVQPAHRGHGIGRALVDAAVHTAIACGFAAVRLRVVAGNTAAERLYRAAGFRPLAVVPGVVLGDGVARDEVEMRRDLRSPWTACSLAQEGPA